MKLQLNDAHLFNEHEAVDIVLLRVDKLGYGFLPLKLLFTHCMQDVFAHRLRP